MANIKSNEREFTSQVILWLNEAISQGTYPFEIATSEASLKISSSETNFPDVQIWLNRASGIGFCGWELKTPDTPADDKTLLEDSTRKARAMHADYFVTWNMRDAIVWRTPNLNEAVSHEHRVRTYPSISPITNVNDLWVVSKQELLKARSREILYDLSILHREGHLHLIDVDSTFFVHILTEAAKSLFLHIQQSLIVKMGKDKKFKEGLFDWAVKQCIANYDDPSFCDAVSKQVVYRLFGKILFYLTLRRFRSDLPVIHLKDVEPSQINLKLREYFEMARQIDYQAVFEEDFTDSVTIPPSGVELIATLIEDLNRFNFSCMPHDVVGNVFEKLIPPEDRHNMGQYFTREELVDLINAFCIQTVDAKVLDPTSGTGTFLIRGYDRLKNMGERDHTTLLSMLWGVDVAHFPSELATINLYRQNLSDYRNFPRIVSKDFFDVKPGDTFKFPPPKDTGKADFMIDEKLPAFDAVVGNFPYIRQELVEKRVKGYKEKLGTVLMQAWGMEYPELFDDKHNLKLSGQADIYAYLFFHTARFLKEDGGRMGIVTSNSWLDVAYGYELQRFFLKKFKIVAILESRCEPWFEEAAINTVVTILERIPSKTAVSKECRDTHLVKFVKIKKRLKDLIPWDMKMEAMRRWNGLDGIVHKIEKTGSEHFELKGTKIENTLQGIATYEDNDFRIRVVRQGELFKNLESAGKTVKWGQYLRSPDVYFEILEKCKDKLVPVNQIADVTRGVTTNNVDFFCITEDTIKHWGLENKFIIGPVIYTPKEIPNISIDAKLLRYYLFVCNTDKKELRATNALKYIQMGETKNYHISSTFKGKDHWYNIGNIKDEACSLYYARQDVSYRVAFNPKGFIVNDNLYRITPKSKNTNKVLCGILNSALFYLGLEINGRINLGDGVLKVQAYEIETLPIINIKNISKNLNDQILKAFDLLLTRPILPIFEEVKMKDRQRLDSLVLEAIGLDPKKYLKPIYDGLCELVRERIELAGMRKKIKTAKTEKDIEKLMEQVISEVIPDGMRKFPEDFIDSRYLKKAKEISVPDEPLKLGKFFFGRQELLSEGGFKYEAASIAEAKFITYSQQPNCYIVKIPEDKVSSKKAVAEYEKYIEGLKDNLFKEFFTRTHDHKLADMLVRKIIK